MFDPTIFDNMKVVAEGAVYDMDFGGKVTVCGRKDAVELASMSRTFAIQFHLKQYSSVVAELQLEAGLKDLAAEILENRVDGIGCVIKLHYCMTFAVDPSPYLKQIQRKLIDIWGDRPQINQEISFVYEVSNQYRNQITLEFGRKINEAQMEDIPDMVSLAYDTLQSLEQIVRLHG